MNTRLLMVASSLALGLAGVVASFAPIELLRVLDSPVAGSMPVLVQLLGGLYLAFALTNWTAKGSLIGGIYARPIAIGNAVHFLTGAIALAKQQLSQSMHLPLMVVLFVYIVFALCFLWLVFGRGPTFTAAS